MAILKKAEIGLKYEKMAKRFLELKGFKNIKIVGNWYSPYDLEAEYNGKKCLIEVKSRTQKSKTQTFTFRDTKIRNLKKLGERHPVFIILINKYGFKVISLRQLLSRKFSDIKFFKYSLARVKIKGKKEKKVKRTINFEGKTVIYIENIVQKKQELKKTKNPKDVSFSSVVNDLLKKAIKIENMGL